MNEPINYFNGNLVDNKKEGKCIITYPSLYFEGEFSNDQKNGYGFVHYYSSGILYRGNWKNDEPCSVGEYTVNDKIIFGMYQNFVNSIDDIVPYTYLLGFIHIPKTGGSDFKNQFNNLLYLQTNFDIKQPEGHITDNVWYSNNNIKCFAFIREPIERFVSGFKFCNNIRNDNLETDINIFIKNDSFLNKIIFKKQIDYLNGDPKNIFLIKFNKNNNYENLILFLKNEFNITFNYDFSEYDKKNVSQDTGLNCVLTQESIDIISNFYSEDIELYSKLLEPYINLNDLQKSTIN
jgi:hypothetical protein